MFTFLYIIALFLLVLFRFCLYLVTVYHLPDVIEECSQRYREDNRCQEKSVDVGKG